MTVDKAVQHSGVKKRWGRFVWQRIAIGYLSYNTKENICDLIKRGHSTFGVMLSCSINELGLKNVIADHKHPILTELRQYMQEGATVSEAAAIAGVDVSIAEFCVLHPPAMSSVYRSISAFAEKRLREASDQLRGIEEAAAYAGINYDNTSRFFETIDYDPVYARICGLAQQGAKPVEIARIIGVNPRHVYPHMPDNHTPVLSPICKYVSLFVENRLHEAAQKNMTLDEAIQYSGASEKWGRFVWHRIRTNYTGRRKIITASSGRR